MGSAPRGDQLKEVIELRLTILRARAALRVELDREDW